MNHLLGRVPLPRRMLIRFSLLCLVGTAVLLIQPTSQAGDPLGTCISKYSKTSAPLLDGQVRKTTGPVTVAGGEGLSVSATAVSPKTGEVTVSVGDDSNTEAMSRAYLASGRTVLDDARAAGVGPGLLRRLCSRALVSGDLQLAAATGSIIDSVCAHDDSGSIEWDGCTTRWRNTNETDPNWTYGVDDAQAFGKETSTIYALTKGGVRNYYNTASVDVIQAAPSSDLNDVNQCYNTSFGVSAAGFGISAGGTVCPDTWNITRTDNTGAPVYQKVQWEGHSYGDREAVAESAYRVTQGRSSTYSITINWAYGL